MDARFPPEEGAEPKVAPDSPEGPAEMVAELDLMVAYIAGDQVLDHFAYAELLRRDQVPPWTPGRWVPPMWPKLMDVLDEGPLDRMSSAARYLDVTLAVARDVLVAHRDPLAVALPMYSSSGQVALHRPIIDADRKAAAEGAPPGNQSLAGASVAGVGLPSAPSNSRRGSCHPRPPDP